jgi:hypothetical protein
MIARNHLGASARALMIVTLIAATRSAASEPSGAPGSPRFVALGSVRGLSSNAAAAFTEGFRGAFSAELLDTEREVRGRVAPDIPLSSRFRLLEGSKGGDTFRIDVAFRLDSIPGGKPRDPKSGSRTTRKPAARTTPVLEATVICVDPVAPDSTIAAGRLRFAPPDTAGAGFAREMGRDVGLLALESLHHRTADLVPDLRLTLARGARVPAGKP